MLLNNLLLLDHLLWLDLELGGVQSRFRRMCALRYLLLWLLLFCRSSGEVPRERNTDFGGRNFALLSGQRLLLKKLSLDLLLYLSQLLLLQLDSLQSL